MNIDENASLSLIELSHLRRDQPYSSSQRLLMNIDGKCNTLAEHVGREAAQCCIAVLVGVLPTVVGFRSATWPHRIHRVVVARLGQHQAGRGERRASHAGVPIQVIDHLVEHAGIALEFIRVPSQLMSVQMRVSHQASSRCLATVGAARTDGRTGGHHPQSAPCPPTTTSPARTVRAGARAAPALRGYRCSRAGSPERAQRRRPRKSAR